MQADNSLWTIDLKQICVASEEFNFNGICVPTHYTESLYSGLFLSQRKTYTVARINSLTIDHTKMNIIDCKLPLIDNKKKNWLYSWHKNLGY